MIDQDYILLIFNCVKYRFKALKQKDTWIPDLLKNILYFHVIGVPQLTNDFEFDISENLLYIKVEDDYNSLPKKVITAYSAINKTYNFKYIFKTDDDQQVTNIKFFHIVINLLNKKYTDNESRIHYGGHIVDVKQAYKSEYYRIHDELPKDLIVNVTRYCSGRFYFLSNDAVRQLIQKNDEISGEYLEDYAIGYNLQDIYKNNMLLLDTNKYFIDLF
jgi:Galactosyltransferase